MSSIDGSSTAYRWAPGNELEPLDRAPRQIDGASGTMLNADDQGCVEIYRPDGSQHRICHGLELSLAPGGRRVYGVGGDRERTAILTMELGDPDHPHVAWLPETEWSMGLDSLVWEDETNVLMATGEMSRTRFLAARIDVITGHTEWVETPVDDPNIVFVRPIARTD